MKAALALLLAGLAAPGGAADADATAKAIVERTNAFRQAQGLEAVVENGPLETIAQGFARFMAKTGKYGHTADGRLPSERASAQGYDYCMVSENIAFHYRSDGFGSAAELAEAFVEGWKNSPEHRENMVEPAATQTGVGLAQGEGGRWYAVQMFGRPKSAAIRFEVENRAGQRVRYRAGERDFSLSPRERRTHLVCADTELAIAHPAKDRPFTASAGDGVRYTVRADGSVESSGGRR